MATCNLRGLGSSPERILPSFLSKVFRICAHFFTISPVAVFGLHTCHTRREEKDFENSRARECGRKMLTGVWYMSCFVCNWELKDIVCQQTLGISLALLML